MESKKIDYLIVGCGIAGALISNQLIKAGKKVVVLDSKNHKSASMVAAGTWNPIAFRRMVTTWRADEMLDEMATTYTNLEQRLNTKLYHLLVSHKIITTDQEYEFWNQQSALIPLHLNPTTKNWNGDQHIGEVLQTGRIDIPEFLNNYKENLQNNNQLSFEDFNYNNLIEQDGKWVYNNYTSDNVIFCEGPNIGNNPFFNWLPFKHVKGDVLTIKAPNLKLNAILKKTIFVLPIGDDCYHVGATYDWKNLNWIPSEEAKETILTKFKSIIETEFEIIDHKAGIRPASFDRRPIMGEHPVKKNLYVFNGFGAKGVFLGPLMAKEMSLFLDGKLEIHPEVSIHRYQKYYSE